MRLPDKRARAPPLRSTVFTLTKVHATQAERSLNQEREKHMMSPYKTAKGELSLKFVFDYGNLDVVDSDGIPVRRDILVWVSDMTRMLLRRQTEEYRDRYVLLSHRCKSAWWFVDYPEELRNNVLGVFGTCEYTEADIEAAVCRPKALGPDCAWVVARLFMVSPTDPAIGITHTELEDWMRRLLCYTVHERFKAALAVLINAEVVRHEGRVDDGVYYFDRKAVAQQIDAHFQAQAAQVRASSPVPSVDAGVFPAKTMEPTKKEGAHGIAVPKHKSR